MSGQCLYCGGPVGAPPGTPPENARYCCLQHAFAAEERKMKRPLRETYQGHDE